MSILRGNKLTVTLSLLFLLIGYVHPSNSFCADNHPRISQFRWSKIKNAYYITARIENGFNSDINKDIDAGIPTSFHFYLLFKRVRLYWDNKILEESEYIHTVTYDTLRKLYTIKKRKRGNPDPLSVTSTEDPSEMRQIMMTFEGYLPIVPGNLKIGKQHYISLRVTLHTGKLPAPWNRILFFISNDFDTQTSRQFLPIKTR